MITLNWNAQKNEDSLRELMIEGDFQDLFLSEKARHKKLYVILCVRK